LLPLQWPAGATRGNHNHTLLLTRVSNTSYHFPADVYANVTLSRADGHTAALNNAVFLAQNCFFEGLSVVDAYYLLSHAAALTGVFWNGAACVDCPEGAFCPGGPRLWPRPGWCVGRCSCNLLLRHFFEGLMPHRLLFIY
jgi:hypothetical protein